MTGSKAPSAAMLVIGDEILSGRTQDANFAYLAKLLGTLGIDLKEGRFVADVEAEIVAAVNALRARYTYVFTSGGIGPTHDDITADAIAAAFGVPIAVHPEAFALLEARYKPGEFTPARQRMARAPEGASLIANPVSGAPGFQIENVFVMAGVPSVFQAMLEDAAGRLERGMPVQSVTISVRIGEGKLAASLGAVQTAHKDVAIGSYPFYRDDGYGVQLVVRGRDGAAVEAAAEAIEAAMRELGATPERVG